MKNSMNQHTTKKAVLGYLWGIIIFAFGLISLIQPGLLVILLMATLGVVLILSGTTQLSMKLGSLSSILGVSSIVAGVLALVTPIIFGQTLWATLLLILGIERLVHVVISVILGFQLKFRFPKGRFFSDILFSALAAVLLIAHPEVIGVTLLRIIAVIIMAVGLLSLVGVYRSKQQPQVIEGDYKEL